MKIIEAIAELEQLKSKQSLTSWDKKRMISLIKFISNVKCGAP